MSDIDQGLDSYSNHQKTDELWMSLAADTYFGQWSPTTTKHKQIPLQQTEGLPATNDTMASPADRIADASDKGAGDKHQTIDKDQAKSILYKDMIRLVSKEIAYGPDAAKMSDAIEMSVNALVDGDLKALRKAVDSCGSKENVSTLQNALNRLLQGFQPEIRPLNWPNTDDKLMFAVANGTTAGLPSSAVLSVGLKESDKPVSKEQEKMMSLFSKAILDGMNEKNWKYMVMDKEEFLSQAAKDMAGFITKDGRIQGTGRTWSEMLSKSDLCIQQAFQRAYELDCVKDLLQSINNELKASGSKHFVVLGGDYSKMGRFPVAAQSGIVNVYGHTLMVVDRDSSTSTDAAQLKMVWVVNRFR